MDKNPIHSLRFLILIRHDPKRNFPGSIQPVTGDHGRRNRVDIDIHVKDAVAISNLFLSASK